MPQARRSGSHRIPGAEAKGLTRSTAGHEYLQRSSTESIRTTRNRKAAEVWKFALSQEPPWQESSWICQYQLAKVDSVACFCSCRRCTSDSSEDSEPGYLVKQSGNDNVRALHPICSRTEKLSSQQCQQLKFSLDLSVTCKLIFTRAEPVNSFECTCTDRPLEEEEGLTKHRQGLKTRGGCPFGCHGQAPRELRTSGQPAIFLKRTEADRTRDKSRTADCRHPGAATSSFSPAFLAGSIGKNGLQILRSELTSAPPPPPRQAACQLGLDVTGRSISDKSAR